MNCWTPGTRPKGRVLGTRPKGRVEAGALPPHPRFCRPLGFPQTSYPTGRRPHLESIFLFMGVTCVTGGRGGGLGAVT